MSSSIKQVNAGADVIGPEQTRLIHVSAAKGLQDVMKSNLGVRGTFKMSVWLDERETILLTSFFCVGSLSVSSGARRHLKAG